MQEGRLMGTVHKDLTESLGTENLSAARRLEELESQLGMQVDKQQTQELCKKEGLNTEEDLNTVGFQTAEPQETRVLRGSRLSWGRTTRKCWGILRRIC
jgi:hypothetical protein